MRIKAIDRFRGIAIVLMVFFTLTMRLSEPNLFFTHNVPGELHIGDFVLPMFLFASGMSLVFFYKKRMTGTRANFALDVIERSGKLALIWFFLSPFSAGFLKMDELLLSVILFIPSLLLVRFSEKKIALVALFFVFVYFALALTNSLPDFSKDYLGGFAAAPFYLPLMLAGVIAGKQIETGNKLSEALVFSALIAFALLLFAPPYKMSASPSFMALSIVFSLLVFSLSERFESGWLEYLGKNPLRYWIMMFVILLVPLDFYALYNKLEYPLGLDPALSAAMALAGMGIVYLASGLIDSAGKKVSEFKRGQEHVKDV